MHHIQGISREPFHSAKRTVASSFPLFVVKSSTKRPTTPSLIVCTTLEALSERPIHAKMTIADHTSRSNSFLLPYSLLPCSLLITTSHLPKTQHPNLTVLAPTRNAPITQPTTRHRARVSSESTFALSRPRVPYLHHPVL